MDDSFRRKYDRETKQAKRDAQEVLSGGGIEADIFRAFQKRALSDMPEFERQCFVYCGEYCVCDKKLGD